MEDETATPLNLATEFQTSDYAAWRRSAERLLGGASFDETLLTKTYSGIVLNPIYFESDAEDLPNSQTRHEGWQGGQSPDSDHSIDWLIAQRIDSPDPTTLNDMLRESLANGQNAIRLELDSGTTLAKLHTILQNIDIEKVPVMLGAGNSAMPLMTILVELCEQGNIEPTKLSGAVAADPLGALARTGAVEHGLNSALDELAAVTKWAATTTPNLRTAEADVRPYHDAGANETQELAIALATGVAYLREIRNRSKIDIMTVASSLQFTFAVGQNFFMEIAKLRAARRLWSQVVSEFGCDEETGTMTMHCETSARNQTRYDAQVNILRNSIAAFAAILGRCDSLSVTPFDAAAGTPGSLARRLARNTQLILGSEIHAAAVSDPCAGSWYVESITRELSEKAWSMFQEIETNGGVAESLRSGFIQNGIQKTADQRIARHANCLEKQIGANAFPNLLDEGLAADAKPGKGSLKTEPTIESRQIRAALKKVRADGEPGNEKAMDTMTTALRAAARAGADSGQMCQAIHQSARGATTVPRMHRLVLAEHFGALRAAVEHHLEQTGSTPSILAISFSDPASYTAKLDYIANFLALTGLACETCIPFSHESAEDAILSACAALCIVCPSEDADSKQIALLCGRLKSRSPKLQIWLAGEPGDDANALRQAGIDQFIYEGVDAHAVLRHLLTKLNIHP